NRVNVNNSNSPAYLYDRCRQNAEFRLLFADRAQRALFGDGALTPERASSRLERRLSEVELAVIWESARWGDYWEEPPYRQTEDWLREANRLRANYVPQRRDIVIAQLRAAGLYPSVDPPQFDPPAGDVEPGGRIDLAVGEGTIYYTNDGSDPRLEGGAIAPTATELGQSPVSELVSVGATVYVTVPQDDSLGLGWTRLDFDPTDWLRGSTGVGYDRDSGYEDEISLDVEPLLFTVHPGIYLRVPFDVDDVSDFVSLSLRMQYDDGFVAYLNGERIAERNAPDPLLWNEGASRSHPDSAAQQFETIDIPDAIEHLRDGPNVLAIHGLNAGSGSSDFLIVPRLFGRREPAGGGIALERSTRLRSRALADGTWSALNEATFIVDRGLRITEIMYHPPSADGDLFEQDEYEFVEIANVGSEVIDIRGFRLIDGVEFDFQSSSVGELAPGEVIVLVENAEAFASRYDLREIRVAGQYSGKLANDGERIVLLGPLDEQIHDFSYSDTWYPETDGTGASLEIVDTSESRTTWSRSASWRAGPADGSPGRLGVRFENGQRPGDLNQDGSLDLSDPISLLRHLFLGAAQPLPCGDGTLENDGNIALLDSSGDAKVDLSDAVHLLNYLFQAGEAPNAGTECLPIEGCPNACP
ncbi:MAG: lamin tail domain-containing protein, partial [Planctomycetota bacterium]